MSLQRELARLDAAYRAGLVRRQLGVTLTVQSLFTKLTAFELLTGAPAVDDWLDRSTTIAMAVRTKVAEETATYLSDVSRLTMPAAPPISPVIADPPTLEQIRTSLWVTGVVSARKRIDQSQADAPAAPSLLEQSFARRAADPAQPLPQRERSLEIIQQGRPSIADEISKSGEMAGAAAARHTINVARDSAIATAKADKRVIGWVRVTSGRPCFFCAALASRGPVYEDDSFDESDARFEGPGQHKVHDHCSCSLRPVTSRSHDEWPEASQRYEAQWEALKKQTKELYGRNPTMLDWRHAFTG